MAVSLNVTTRELVEYTPAPPSLEERKETLRATIKVEQSTRFAAGWTHEFSVGTHTLDLRDADDKANWTLLLIKTQGMISAGAGAMPVTIRTAANETISIPASETGAAMQAFLAWGEDMLSHKWALDAAVAAAQDDAATDSIDPTAGWP